MAIDDIVQQPGTEVTTTGSGASVNRDDVVFYKNIKYKIEDLLKVTTKARLEEVLGVKITNIGNWGITEDGYLWYVEKPTFERDDAYVVKFKDKSNTPYYLSMDEPSTFPFHTKTYQEVPTTAVRNITSNYNIEPIRGAIDAPAQIKIEVSGSLPNIDKLISYNSITCTVEGRITYMSTDYILERESFSITRSVLEPSSDWSVILSTSTSKSCRVDTTPTVFIDRCQAQLNYTYMGEEQIVYSLALHEVGYAFKWNEVYRWENGKLLHDFDGITIDPVLVSAVDNNTMNAIDKQSAITDRRRYIANTNLSYIFGEYHTIPRYKINNSYNYKVYLSYFNIFNNNENIIKQGHYVFNNNLITDNGSAKTPIFWGTNPQCYVVVAGETLNGVGSLRTLSSLTSIQLSLNNGRLTYDTSTYVVDDNDLVFLYWRTPKAEATELPSRGFISSSQASESVTTTSYTLSPHLREWNTSIKCEPDIKIYKINNGFSSTLNYKNTTLSTSYLEDWSNQPLPNKLIETTTINNNLVMGYVNDQSESQWSIGGLSAWKGPTYSSFGYINLSCSYKIPILKKDIRKLNDSVTNADHTNDLVSWFSKHDPNLVGTSHITTNEDHSCYLYSKKTINENNNSLDGKISTDNWTNPSAGFYDSYDGFLQTKFQCNPGILPARIHPWLNGTLNSFDHIVYTSYRSQIFYCASDYTLRSYMIYRNISNSGYTNDDLEKAFCLEIKLENKDGDTAAWAVVIIKNGKLYGVKPSPGPITYTCEVVSDTLIFTFTNPNETDLIIKVGSDYGLFNESNWGKISPNSSSNFEIPSISNIMSHTQNPYIEYYDLYLKKNVKVLLANLI